MANTVQLTISCLSDICFLCDCMQYVGVFRKCLIISRNLKSNKKTSVDIRRDVLRPPHDTTLTVHNNSYKNINRCVSSETLDKSGFRQSDQSPGSYLY